MVTVGLCVGSRVGDAVGLSVGAFVVVGARAGFAVNANASTFLKSTITNRQNSPLHPPRIHPDIHPVFDCLQLRYHTGSARLFATVLWLVQLGLCARLTSTMNPPKTML